MSTLVEIFRMKGIGLYQDENTDLDHFYPEPYQDEGDEIQEIGEPFETDKSRKIRHIDLMAEDRTFSLFSYFMDGSRRTYKIGDLVLEGKKIYPIVAAQLRAGSTERDLAKKLHSHGELKQKNLLLVTDRINSDDFREIRARIKRTQLAKNLKLDVVSYAFNRERDSIAVNSAIAAANNIMHDMEIDILKSMVASGEIAPRQTGRMLIVDGPLQYIVQDNGKSEFADLFYNVVGVSKSFNPMLPTSSRTRRGGTQIGAVLLKLAHGDRTPVFLKKNAKERSFGCWYLRIRPVSSVSNPLEGIIKVEKMATVDDEEGLNSDVVDNISLSLLNEGAPTCYGKDKRWATHLYPVYLTETLVKSTFESNTVFINKFRRNFS